MKQESESEILAETENLLAWRSLEDMGYVYHLEFGSFSLHLVPDEWDELLVLIGGSSPQDEEAE
ncbi:MAG: hypothetical protein JSV68_11455 [Anaerolineaceae bacterium]|nr:MAG: hypothetical protein JSV68_11455 [Anaerolineaceae bacterium]